MYPKNLTRIFLSLALFVLPGQLLAQSVIEQLKSFSEQHQYSEAYELASKYREEMEGDPDFDYLYGVAAIDTQHINEGVFALERVVFSQPKNHLARLELARGYFLQGDDVRAMQAFKKVLKVKPPESVVQIVDKFVAAIRIRERQYKTSATAYFDFEAGYDSNVNAGPAKNTLGIFEDILSVDNFEKSDSYTRYSLGGKLNHPLTPHTSLFLNADAAIRRNIEETINNNSTITLQGGTKWQTGNYKYRLALLGQQYTLNKSVNRNIYGVGLEGSYATSKQHQISFSLNINGMKYPDSPIYDSTQTTLTINSFSKGEKLSWYGGLNMGVQSAKEPSETAKSGTDRTISGGNIGTLIPLSKKSNINLNYSTTLSQYSGIYFGSSSKRKDTLSALGLTYNYLVSDKWKARLGINYSHNNSNVALLTYKRSQFIAGFQRIF